MTKKKLIKNYSNREKERYLRGGITPEAYAQYFGRKVSKKEIKKLEKGVRSITRCGACGTKLERAVNPMIGHHFLNCFKCFPYYTRARK